MVKMFGIIRLSVTETWNRVRRQQFGASRPFKEWSWNFPSEGFECEVSVVAEGIWWGVSMNLRACLDGDRNR